MKEQRGGGGLLNLRMGWACPMLELHRDRPIYGNLLAVVPAVLPWKSLPGQKVHQIPMGCHLSPDFTWFVEGNHPGTGPPNVKVLDQAGKSIKYLSNLRVCLRCHSGYIWVVSWVPYYFTACLSSFKSVAWNRYQFISSRIKLTRDILGILALFQSC